MRGGYGWEAAIGRWAHDLPDWATSILEIVDHAGDRWAPAAAAVVVAGLGWRWRAAGVLLSGLSGWAMAHALKALFDRPRPTTETLGRLPHDILTNAAFPSTHATIAAALAVSIVLLGRPRRWLVALLLAVPVLTALARLHLGVHWFLDVVGGLALGSVLAAAVAALVGLPPTGAVARAGRDDEVVVATFNIRNGRVFDGWNSWPFRARRAATVARSLGADLLCVQEAYAFQARYLSAALPGYVRLGRGRNRRGGEWCPVYVRADRFEVESSITRWFGDESERPGTRMAGAHFPRIATRVRAVETATGTVVDLVNAHLDSADAGNRLRSIEQMVGWLDPEVATVVAGDLNATWKQEPDLFARLTGVHLVDAVPTDAGGTAHAYRGGIRHRRIDHIFVSAHWSVVEARVVADDRTRRFPSDHWPVTACLRLTPDPVATPTPTRTRGRSA